MDFAADMKKNIASAESDFNEQKSMLQEEAELGDTAAAVAAKMPVDPGTVIEGFMMWRKIREEHAARTALCSDTTFIRASNQRLRDSCCARRCLPRCLRGGIQDVQSEGEAGLNRAPALTYSTASCW